MPDQTKIIVGQANLSIDGEGVGHTQGGVLFRKSNEHLDVESDQAAGIARKEIIMQKAFVSTTMLEGTLANLRKALGEPIANQFSGSALSVGEEIPAVVEHLLIATGYADSTKTAVRSYRFYRCVAATEEVEHVIGARDQVSSIPITFEVLKDEAHDFAFFVITDA